VWSDGPWAVDKVDTAGQFLGCAATRTYSNGAMLLILRKSFDDAPALMLIGQGWQARGVMHVVVDGRPVATAKAHPTGGGITYETLSREGRSAVFNGHWLQLMGSAANASARYSLKGSADAIEMAQRCAAHFNKAPPEAQSAGQQRPPSAEVPRAQPAAPQERPSASATTAVKAAPPSPSISSGTGFFVDARGFILTNAHVVRGCHEAVVRSSDGQTSSVAVVAADSLNDLALLRPLRPLSVRRVAEFAPNLKRGQDAFAFGYPYAGTLASSGSFTEGRVSSMAGAGDNSGRFQMTTPVQPGNSGGPVLDAQGGVIGVTVARFGGDGRAVEQNVNFAIKTATAHSFLVSQRVVPKLASGAASRLDATVISDWADEISVLVVCRRS